jgi:thioredoxin-related protein
MGLLFTPMRWLLVLLFVWGEASAQEPPAWFADTLLFVKEDAADAAKEGKRVMLYFGQDGCPYCKQLMEVNFRQARIVDKMRKSFVAVALNIWGDREVTWIDGRAMSEKQLAAALKLQFTPTLFFLDEKGEVALRVNGYLPPERFEAALDYVSGKMEKKLPFADYKETPGKASETLNPQSFFMKPPYDLRRQPGAKPLAVLFETPHCAGCDELHSEAFKRKEVLSRLNKFDVVRISSSSGDAVIAPGGQQVKASAWASQLKLTYVPAMVFFDDRGAEVFRIEAYMRPFHLAGSLEYVASGAYRTEPSFQRFLQSEAERQRARGEPVDLWK